MLFFHCTGLRTPVYTGSLSDVPRAFWDGLYSGHPRSWYFASVLIVSFCLPLKEVNTLPTRSFTVCAYTFQVLVRNVPTDRLSVLTTT